MDPLPKKLPVNPQKLVAAYADELLKIARERKDLIALDADLVLDTGLSVQKIAGAICGMRYRGTGHGFGRGRFGAPWGFARGPFFCLFFDHSPQRTDL